MPQKKDNTEPSPEIKHLQADVKGGQGSFFLAVIISIVYIVKALIGRNFNFFFSLFVPELLLKSARFTAEYPATFGAQYAPFFRENLLGKLPNLAVWIALAVIYGAALAFGIAARKKHMLVIGELVIYGTDTVLLLLSRLFAFPEMLSLNSWIDPVFHIFVLALLVRSVVATVKLKKRGFTEAQMDFY